MGWDKTAAPLTCVETMQRPGQALAVGCAPANNADGIEPGRGHLRPCEVTGRQEEVNRCKEETNDGLASDRQASGKRAGKVWQFSKSESPVAIDFVLGELTFDPDARALRASDGAIKIEFTRREGEILTRLCLTRGTWIAAETLAGDQKLVDPGNTVRSHIANLRRKLRSLAWELASLIENDSLGAYRLRETKPQEPTQDQERSVDQFVGEKALISSGTLGTVRTTTDEATRRLQSDPAELERARRYQPAALHEAVVDRLLALYAGNGAKARLERGGGAPLERKGSRRHRRYPVIVFPNTTSQSLDSVLSATSVDARMRATVDPTSLAASDPYPRLARWLTANPTEGVRAAQDATWSGWNFCMTALRRAKDGTLRLSARLGEYGAILDSCDALIDEAFLTPNGEPWPLRDALQVEDPLADARRRAAGIGIAAVIVLADREADDIVLKALVGKRSARVGTYPNTWHVAPAGMFNWRFTNSARFSTAQALPDGDDHQRFGSYDPGDILRSVLTEYAEETKSIREMEANTARAYLDQHTVVQDLVENARIEFTGVAFDLANLRPEICVLIYIGDPEWQATFKLNYEYGPLSAPSNSAEARKAARQLQPLTVLRRGRDVDDEAIEVLDPAQTVAAGAAAFWLGVDRAREIFRSGG